MRTIKRTFAVAMTLVMLLGMAVGLTGTAAPTGTGSITITKPGTVGWDTTAGAYKAYLIFTLVRNGTSFDYTLENAFALPNSTHGTFFDYAISEGFTTLVDEDALIAHIRTLTEGNPNATSIAGIDELAALFEAYIGEMTDASTITYTAPTASALDASVVISDLPHGYYLVVGGGTTAGETTPGVPAPNTIQPMHALVHVTDTLNPTVNLKTDAPTITKEVEHHSGDGVWQNWTDVNIGDTVNFRLTSAVPNMRGYSSYVYTIHDNMSIGLDFDETSLEVRVNNVLRTEGVDYTLVIHDPPATVLDCTFEIRFVPAVFRTLSGPIEVTYSATLNSGAVIAGVGNPNDVQLEYSNNP